MSIKIWKTTKLYSALIKKTGDYQDSIKNLLDNPSVMDSIENILSSSSTTPKDFTLHDANHSFRVAERMWDVIAEKTKSALTDYELGFLLLSAYIHDIGMSPDYSKVERHRKFLTTDNKDCLNPDEIQAFQKWIDNDDKSPTIDIIKDKIEDVNIANYILTYYIRHMHNDWSGEWINETLSTFLLKDYLYWQSDLILLCKSHHYDIDELLKNKFDLKPVGNTFLHLRYLAMCLRISDVLENDPERTPEVLLRHRSIAPSSVIYWEKDKWFTITKTNNEFFIYARPERAYIEKAIWETADIIQKELQLCNSLKNIKPLNVSRFTDKGQYEWTLEPIIDKDIHAKDNTYVYIQGGFKPNTHKILELLGGSQLYGNPIWAYRELIQNAFDAIKEKIAYQIINENRDPKVFLRQLGDLHAVKISLEKRSDGYWLICKDDGVGMTKQIIEKFFLESGSSGRHELKELERECEERGFHYGRTGQFGIGVLSYFMIAEKIIVKTKREQLTGYTDSESLPWRFEINGTHDFGELIKYNSIIKGTEIELKLKDEISSEIAIWDRSFKDFLNREIVRTPCIISYISEKYNINFNTGWLHSKTDITAIFHDQMFKNFELNKSVNNAKIISSKEKKKEKRKYIELNEAVEEAIKILDFLYDEGEIPLVGKYRIFIPYFKLLSGNNSFHYIKEDTHNNEYKLKKLNEGYYWIAKIHKIQFSLKGIKIEIQKNQTLSFDKLLNVSSAYVELDIDKINNSALAVSRHSLNIENLYADVLDIINNKLTDLVKLNEDLFNNIYSSINKKITHKRLKEIYWINKIESNYNECTWRKIDFPFTTQEYHHLFEREGNYNGKILCLLDSIRSFFGSYKIHAEIDYKLIYKLGMTDSQYTRLGRTNTYFLPVAIEFETEFEDDCIKLPEEWNKLSFFLGDEGILISKNSEHFRFYDPKVYSTFLTTRLNTTINDLDTKTKCFTFLVYCILKYQSDRWIGLCELHGTLILHAFTQLNIEQLYGITNTEFLVVSMNNWMEATQKDIDLPEIQNKEEYIIS